MIDSKAEFWQKEENGILNTNIRPVCDICGKEVNMVIEFADGPMACFGDCFQGTMRKIAQKNSKEEFLWVRMLCYFPRTKKRCPNCEKEFYHYDKRRRIYCCPKCQMHAGVKRSRRKAKSQEANKID